MRRVMDKNNRSGNRDEIEINGNIVYRTLMQGFYVQEFFSC